MEEHAAQRKKSKEELPRLSPEGSGEVAESGRPGRPELLAKKGRIIGGVGCPTNCRTSGKLWRSSDPLELFRKMLHFGKIQNKFGYIWAKIQENLGKICEILKKQQQIQQFLTKILRLETGAKECIV